MIWLTRLLSWGRGLKLTAILSGAVTILIGLLVIFIPSSVRSKKKHKADSNDTRKQLGLDKKDRGKSDDEIIDDFASKFGPK